MARAILVHMDTCNGKPVKTFKYKYKVERLFYGDAYHFLTYDSAIQFMKGCLHGLSLHQVGLALYEILDNGETRKIYLRYL